MMTTTCNYKIADVVWQIGLDADGIALEMLSPYKTDAAAQEVIRDLQKPEIEQLLIEINARLVNRYDGLMLHGGTLVYKDKAYIFAAPSGIGKTTHLRMWERLCDGNAFILCGDKPLLRLTDGGATVYCGPWKGKEGLGRDNAAFSLGGIYFLHRGEKNRITAATTAQKLRCLTDSVLSQKSADGRIKLIQNLGQLCDSVPAYILECTKTQDAAEFVRAHIEKVNESET